MKKIVVVVLLFLGMAGFARSQRVYFIYLESEQPFFVKLQEKTYSSGAGRFLILPGLSDSSYKLRVGFPQNKYPDQLFTVAVNNRDHGFGLVNRGEAGWSLTDLQTSAEIAAVTGNSNFRMEPRKVSAFTEVLARAANDPSLRFTSVRIQPSSSQSSVAVQASVPEPTVFTPPATETAEQIITAPDSVSAEATSSTALPETVDSQKVTETAAPALETAAPLTETGYQRSMVTRRSESSTTQGFGLVFIDEYDGRRDTISILIPPPTGRLEASIPEPGSAASRVPDKPAPMSVNCKSLVSESELNKSARKMKVASDESVMLAEVNKLTRSKCVSTAQVRELSNLFPGDGGRLKLFQLLYPKTSDPASFPSLEPLLTDEYFITRFRTLLAGSQ